MNRKTCFAAVASAIVLWAPAANAAPAATDDAIERDRGGQSEATKSHDRGAQPFWSSLHGGYQVLDLTTFEAGNQDAFSAELVPTTASGPVGQLALGLRLLGFSLGARGTVMSMTNVNGGGLGGATLWGIDGELGLHVAASPRIDPYLLLGGGYTAIGGLHPRGMEAVVSVRGYNAHVGLGLDYFVDEHWAIGVHAMGQLLFVARPGVDARDLLTPKEIETIGQAKARALEADGSSVGTAVSIVAGPSVHF